jgi:transposase
MMGFQSVDQGRFFYDFCLDDQVPPDHLLRKLDAVLDLSWLRQALKPFYSHTGRPSVDPELMMRMLLVGYCYGIRSERRLCEEVHLNLAYRWFCRLGLEDRVPDHSSFSTNRHGRFRDSDAFRLVFESVVRRCMAAGLVSGEGFAVDASVLEADASRYQGTAPEEIDWSDPKLDTRAVREYLAALDPEPDPSRKAPKVISPSDPAAAWTAKANKRVQFGYGLNYLIDTGHAIIVDVEATPARTFDEVAASRTMIERTGKRLGLKPARLAADTAYGTGRFLGWLVAQGIAPHIPVWDKSRRRDGSFARDDFTFDAEKDLYICPGGKTLKTTGWRYDRGRTLLYRARKRDCESCALKARCCPKEPQRKIPRDVNEAARDLARALAGTRPYEQSRRERKKVEMLFAHLKRHLGFERLRLRGLSGARDEFLLAATVQNLRRLAKLTTIPPPPCCASA